MIQAATTQLAGRFHASWSNALYLYQNRSLSQGLVRHGPPDTCSRQANQAVCTRAASGLRCLACSRAPARAMVRGSGPPSDGAWTTLAALAAPRVHVCTLLELPVGEPVDLLDGQELALSEFLAGAPCLSPAGWGMDRRRRRPTAPRVVVEAEEGRAQTPRE